MNFDLRFYWRMILRRAPAMIALIILCVGLAVVIAVRAPTTYRTQAVLLVQSAQIAEQLAASTVQTAATESIEIIRQQLLTRANMLDLARELNVLPRDSSRTPDEIVSEMRRSTSINSRARRGEPIQITIAFEARTGAIAANVVNEYVTQIINANVEMRTGRAEDTLDFFEQEVRRLSEELDMRSGQIAQFQSENADALPADQAFRMTRQSRLLEQISNWERELANLRDRRARLITIFEATGQINAEAAQPLTDDERQLEALERELVEALTVLSESNPRVLALERRINVLRAAISADRASANVEDPDDDTLDPNRFALDLQLEDIDNQIEDLTEQMTEAEQELVALENAIGRTPANAITLSSLNRDYENVREQYDRAVTRLAEASTGERIELSSRGQRITLIEPANVPEEPYSPDRRRMVAMGIAAGLGLAGALFVLLELLNRSVRRPAEITRALGIQPLATIPYIESSSRRLLRRFTQVTVLLLVLAGVPAALWAVDTYYLPLDQLADRIINRLGLT